MATGVPLGRTEVLVPSDALFRALSHGQGPGGARFEGRPKVALFMLVVELFCDVFKVFVTLQREKRLGSDLVLQTSRLVRIVQLIALFYTGMLPWALGFKRGAQKWMSLIC